MAPQDSSNKRKSIFWFGLFLLVGSSLLLLDHRKDSEFDPRKNAYHRWERFFETMKEPNLSPGSNNVAEVYRFLWLRTFHKAVAVRMEQLNSGNWDVTLTTLTGQSGFRGGGTFESKVTKQVSKDSVQPFLEKLDSSGFWKLSTFEKEALGLDGSEWILEARKGRNYHSVDRWIGRDIRGPCLELIKLSGFEPVEIY